MNPDAKTETAASTHEVSKETVPHPPVARREPVEHVLHGDRRVDHYAWLRQKENPEVIAYLEAENAYTDAILKPTEALQESFYQEMLGRIQQTDLTVPYRLRGYLYFTRTEEGKQYPIHCRRREAEGSAEELLLDLNQLAAGHSFLALGSFDVSDDSRFLAYTLDTTGYRQYILHVKDLLSGATLSEKIERVTSAAWAADNHTLFYTVEDETTKRSHRLYRHALGSVDSDTLLYEETDERFRIEVERSRSRDFLFLTIASHTASEVRFLRADQPSGEFQLMAEREDNHEYYVGHHPGPSGDVAGGVFHVRTNSGGRTFRLVSVSASDPRRESWREFIPNRPEVMLAAAEVFKTHLVLFEREGGLPFLRIVDLTYWRLRTALNSQSPPTTLPLAKIRSSTLRTSVFNTNPLSLHALSSITTFARASVRFASSSRSSAVTIHRSTSASVCMLSQLMALACRSRLSTGGTRRATAPPRCSFMATAATVSPCRSISVRIV
jgi:oligopeptidase B